MIEELIKLANYLDEQGAHKEAEEIDTLIEKMAGSQGIRNLAPGTGFRAPEPEGSNLPHKWEKELMGTDPGLAKKLMELKDLNRKRIELMKEIDSMMGGVKKVEEPKVNKPNEPELSPEEADMMKLMSSDNQEVLKSLAHLAELADRLDNIGAASEANLIDEFLKTADPVLPDVMKWKEEDKKTERSKRYDADYHNSLQIREPKPTKEKEEHHIHTYQQANDMSLSTRYCPDHVGYSLGRVGEATYQCPLDGAVYNWEVGYTDYQGNKHPGGSVGAQTPSSTQYEIPHRMFDSREKTLNVVN